MLHCLSFPPAVPFTLPDTLLSTGQVLGELLRVLRTNACEAVFATYLSCMLPVLSIRGVRGPRLPA